MGFHSLLMRLIICQKQQQQRQANTRSIYKYYYSGLSSSSFNPPIFRSSSIIIPNFQIHTLSRIASPNPNLIRNIMFKRLWYNYDDLLSSEEGAHTYYYIGVFSNSIGDRILIDDHLDTLNSEIYHCCEVNQVIYGFSLLAGIIKLGLVPNIYTYCPLLIGLMFQNRFTEATSMFDMLIMHREIQPDMLTYETIIQVCFDMGYNLDITSFSIFLTHAKKVIGYEPLDIEYCRKKQHLCQDRDLREAYENAMFCFVTDHMEVDNFCKEKRFNKALFLISHLEDQFFVVGIEVYNIVFSHMVYAGEIDQAVDLFYRVCQHKLKPSAKTYATIILGLSYNGLWDKALDLLTNIYSSDYLPDDFKLACDNFFQERLPPYLDMPYLTHVSTSPA